MINYLVATALVSSVLTAGVVWKAQEWRYGAEKAQALEQAREDSVLRRKVADTAATVHEQEKVRIDTRFVAITEKVENVVEKTVYRDRVCLDPDGLQLLNEAVRATHNPGKPEDPVR